MSKARTSTAPPPSGTPSELSGGETVRESVEAIVVAIILTLTFRTFLGENYQIPTGSMAPTLQGRHMDVVCPQCQHQYRTGASQENPDHGPHRLEVTSATCPICRYRVVLDKQNDLNQRSFGGDRIIVSKLAYVFNEPQRWDVFVFKYPGNPKINYIKRLVGLPGEKLLIRHGDVLTASAPDPAADGIATIESAYQIARKPADKVTAMLQLVDDTYYVGHVLEDFDWPLRWIPLDDTNPAWQVVSDNFPLNYHVPSTPDVSWLAYRHLIPREQDWQAIVRGNEPDLSGYDGTLITDYYAYNESSFSGNTDSLNWVGDLAVEFDVEVISESGDLLVNLVEGGIHHECRIDLASGKASLTLDDGKRTFQGAHRQAVEVVGQTPVRGPGRYTVQFANVDDQLFLWIDGKPISFVGPTTFNSPTDLQPQWSEEDPGDFRPVRVGARQAELRLHRLRVLRDIYYIATSIDDEAPASDYKMFWAANTESVWNVLSNPRTWAETDLFSTREQVTYSLGPDQFFPMGDNSPQSKDGRLWSHHTDDGFEPPPFVKREMLIGKAVFIYWPHGWRIFTDWVGLIPNYQRIGLIR